MAAVITRPFGGTYVVGKTIVMNASPTIGSRQYLARHTNPCKIRMAAELTVAGESGASP